MNLDQVNFNSFNQPLETQYVGDLELLSNNHIKDYSSIQKLIKLPLLRKLQPSQINYLPVSAQLSQCQTMTSELKQSTTNLLISLSKQFSLYQSPQSYSIPFPQSKFPSVAEGQRNLISYEQKNIVQNQDTFRDRLSQEQILQIKQTGEFKIKSNMEYITLPYVWKVNDTLFKGTNNITKAWNATYAYAHSILYNSLQNIKEVVPQQLKKLTKLPKRLFSLIFGLKSMQTSYQVDYHQQISIDFWNQVLDKHYQLSSKQKQWGSALFAFFEAGYIAEDRFTILNQGNNNNVYQAKLNQQSAKLQAFQDRIIVQNIKVNEITSISSQFDANWAKNKKKFFVQATQEVKSGGLERQRSLNQSDQLIKDLQKVKDQEVLQRFNDKKFGLYTKYLQTKLPALQLPNNFIEALITLLTLMQIVTKKERILQNRKSQQKTKVQALVRKQHQIKSLNYKWFAKQTKELYQPIQQHLQSQYYRTFISPSLSSRLSAHQKQVYALFLQYKHTYQTRLLAKKTQLPCLLSPKRTFHSTYMLLPPYEVIRKESGGYTNYSMTKDKHMQITTDWHFWKIKLYCMRIKCWTINCVVFLIYLCYKGPLGIRCLYGYQQFRYSQNINYSTGQIINQTRLPMFGVFLKVLDGISKSRKQFQDLPDRGIFGKNFSRLFNYIECYVFRFLFVGVILTLILYPIAIVVSSVLMGALIITFWAWVPIILLITYLFNILIFQFQSNYIPHGFFIRSFPLISLIISVIVSVLTVIGVLFYFFIIAPLLAFFVGFWAILHRILRTLSDGVMICLISKLGRTPSRDTVIAKKISGPGMSKQFYMSINEEDVYILVQAQLEQIFMTNFNRIYIQKINKPVQTYNNVYRIICSSLSSPLIPPHILSSNPSYNQNNASDAIFKSVSSMLSNYSSKYQNYMARYPNRPYNIRFTQNQIQNYFQNTVSIVKNFVEKRYLQAWIFEEFNLNLNDYEELTRKVWARIFNCGEEIFQPLEKIDQRFKLEDQYSSPAQSLTNTNMKRNVNSVMKALQGQVILKPRNAKISSYNHGLMSRQHQIQTIHQVISNMRSNSNGNVNLSFSSAKTIFYPNLAVKQVKKLQTYFYNSKKRQLQLQ